MAPIERAQILDRIEKQADSTRTLAEATLAMARSTNAIAEHLPKLLHNGQCADLSEIAERIETLEDGHESLKSGHESLKTGQTAIVEGQRRMEATLTDLLVSHRIEAAKREEAKEQEQRAQKARDEATTRQNNRLALAIGFAGLIGPVAWWIVTHVRL